ncbi:polysaccharide pyruvyl transferase family protein [Bifidobacterium pullorum]|uniref:polysaccharide pyruvyl transferase family protein n=1 Tax=Bifidobacterium pullorum TaxID=78448 RepID=UPI0024AE2A14|nr:polysaccharide pyruvyl transferase family protein [Bifidobacterium pullorum]
MKVFLNHFRNRRNKQRYLVSTAGQPNWGDEYITRAWVRYLSHAEPDSEIWLDCPNPGHASLLFQGEHPRLHVVNTLWQLVWNTSHLIDDSNAAAQQMRDWIRMSGTPREDCGLDLLRRVDSIHFLGGGYINQLWKANVLLLVAAAEIKKYRPESGIYGTGLGLAPLQGVDLALARQSLANFDHISVRDDASAEIAGGKGCDDAFLGLLRGNEDWWDTEVPGRAFVCLQQDVVGRWENSIDVIIESLKLSGVDTDEPVYIVEGIPPEDSWSLELFKRRWKGDVRLMPFSHLWNRGFPDPKDSVWVSSRFHMHLLGAATGARGIVARFGNEYYDIKHGSLLKIGTGWSNLDLSSANPVPISATNSVDFIKKAKVYSLNKRNEAKELYG